MQKSMTDVSTAFRKKDTSAAKAAFSKASKSCSECHADFRDE
jgi:cytochrome c556